MIITRTPYRLSFFGGGTDYNPWFEKHGGLVVGSSFSKYCWISLRKLPPFFEHKTRAVYSKMELVNENIQIEHSGIRSCLQYLDFHEGLEIHHDGDLPARSGIGSSSSFTVGFLHALYSLKNQDVSPKILAEQAIYVEQTIEGQSVGIQDQIFASYGGMQIIEMGPTNQFKVTPLKLSIDYKNYFQSHILLGFSGISRFSSEVAQGQIEKIKQQVIDDQFHGLYQIAKEGVSLLLESAEMEKIGKLFAASWEIKKRLTTKISNQLIDDIYSRGMKQGAFGGRLLGAGEGGFFVFIAPPERHQQIKQALPEIKVWVPFEFEEEGSKVILHHEE